MATGTEVGAVSFLSYGFRLFQFPVGILGVSISGANLVYFSDLWKSEKKKEAIEALQLSYLLSIFFMLPAMFFLYEFSREIIELIFERGAFLKVHGDKTSLALKCYMVGLPFYGVYKIFAPTFYAIDKPKYPINISIFSIILNIVFCVSLTPKYGFMILALGTSLSMMINSCLQSFFMNKFLHLKANFFFNQRFFKLVFSSTVSFLIVNRMRTFFFAQEGFWHMLLDLFIIGVVYLLSYAIVLFISGERELMSSLVKKILKKLKH